ncbi:unnamed protein product, partial [Prorocentrum cordatum]
APFAVPAKCSLISPLAIADAASGAYLSSFREEYKAAGAAWMLDPICSDIDDVTVGLLEGAMGAWSEERLEPDKPGVCLTEALTMLAGRAVVTTWHAAMGEALQQSSEDRAWHLFNAALSVPIRMRLLADGDATHLAALTFSEKMFSARAASGAESFWQFAEKTRRLTSAENCFAKQEPASKLEAALKAHGLQFKGKARTAATAAALKGQGLFVFIMNGFRVARLTGDAPKDEKPSVIRVIGRDGKAPAMLHALFKKMELVECIFHAALLMDKGVGNDMAAFKTPLHILQKFDASGADGLVASHRASDSGGGADEMETLFALHVAEHRDAVDVKTEAMIDVAWPLCSSAFDDEIAELAQQELQCSTTGFVWRTHLTETSQGVGARYRAFVAACTGGPIPADPELDANLVLSGMSELGGEQKEELQKLQEQLKQLRRRTLEFVTLPSVGAASGAEYAVAQMQSLWGVLSLGRCFGRKKNDVRAFILSAELFPRNVVKQGGKARMSEQMACDEAKSKRVIEFFLQKRQKDDILIFLDGRSRANRRVTESFETRLESGGPRAHVECRFVHEQPTKKEGPRSAARASSYTKNNRGAAIFSMPLKGPPRKVVHRAEFNARGESSTADASYSGIPTRRFSELPRMDHETKTSILGGIDSKGHPFSRSEVKPRSLWQTLVEHHEVTRVVDFTPGSGALAVAASGAMECEGIAANDARRDRLDSIVDRRAMHMVGHDEGRAEQLGGDAEFVEKASKCFSGTTMEAKRLLMPVAGDGEDEEEEGDGASSSDESAGI